MVTPTDAGGEACVDPVRIAAIVDDVPDIIAQFDRDLRVVYVNAAFRALTGPHAARVLGLRLDDVLAHGALAERWHAALRSVFETGERDHGRYEMDLPGGRRMFDAWIVPERGPDRSVATVLVVARDATEQHRVEVALQESEERLRSITEGLPAAVYRSRRHARDGAIVVEYLNHAGPALFGLEGVDVATMADPASLVHPDDRERRRANRTAIIARGGGVGIEEYRITLGDGRTRWVRERQRTTVLPGGDSVTDGFIVDITDERATREALRLAEERTAAVMDGIPGFVSRVSVGADGSVVPTYAGSGASRVLGRSTEELGTLTDAMTIVHPDDRERAARELSNLIASPGTCISTIRVLRPDGETRWLNVHYRSSLLDTGEMVADGMAVDVTGRVEAERELREARERLEAIADQLPGFLFELTVGHGPDSVVVRFAGSGLSRLTGYTAAELTAMPSILPLVHPDDHSVVDTLAGAAAAVRTTGSVVDQTVEFRIVARDGRSVWVRGPIRLQPGPEGRVAVEGLLLDVTDRRRVEDALASARRFESLGVLAGGVAHDFNNILATILGNADLALGDLPASAPAVQPLRDIADAARRAAVLTKQLLAYAGRSRVESGRVDMSAVVVEASGVLASALPEGVTVRTELDTELPVIDGDQAQLGQVVRSLVWNAAEAYPDGRGIVTVRTRVGALGRRDLDEMVLGHRAIAGRYVLLEVADAGIGMSDATSSQMFDPFFTTKADGRGLGLAAVVGIVGAHRGAIGVATASGSGTMIWLALPVAGEHVRAGGDEAASRSRGAPTAGATTEAPADTRPTEKVQSPDATHRRFPSPAQPETVLVVDDEPSVLGLACRVLGKAGYRIRGSLSGEEAVAIVRDRPEAVDVVVLDLSMPGMNGEATYRELRALAPDLPVVLCTGYDDRDTAERFAGLGLAGVIGKPYDPDLLIGTVEQALAGRRRG